jgi:hypothetical protein
MASQGGWEDQWKTFLDSGAFKVLALAGLSGNAHSVVLYLINCFVSGIRDVLTSSSEMSVLLGISAGHIDQILSELSDMQIVKMDRNSGDRMILSLNMDPQTWRNLRLPAQRDCGQRRRIGDAANVRPIRPQEKPHSANRNWSQADSSSPQISMDEPSSPSGADHSDGLVDDEGAASTRLVHSGGSLEALNFPLRQVGVTDGRHKGGQTGGSPSGPGAENGPISMGAGATGAQGDNALSSVDQILADFLAAHPDANPARERLFAEALVATHPHEQIADIIQRFPQEIRSLGLLLGAWLHFSQKRDLAERAERPALLDEYRKQAEDADGRLRLASRRMLKLLHAGRIELSSDEEVLLHVLHEHEVPRRQLYWALRMRSRYPALADFFSEVSHLAQAPAGQPS